MMPDIGWAKWSMRATMPGGTAHAILTASPSRGDCSAGFSPESGGWRPKVLGRGSHGAASPLQANRLRVAHGGPRANTGNTAAIFIIALG
jgi:hypothetical protein